MSIVQWIIRAVEMIVLLCFLKAVIKDLKNVWKNK